MNCCTRCKNPLKTRPSGEQTYLGLGKYEMIIEEYCPYCEWKGDSGMGAELKELIKQAKRKNDKIQNLDVH